MYNLKVKNGYLIGAVLGLFIGAMLYYVQPTTWQGVALIKVGKYNGDTFIETPADLAERIYSRSFIYAVAESAKKDELVRILSPQEEARMSVKQTKTGESLSITVSCPSAELAQITADTIAMLVVAKHEVLMSAYLLDIRKEISWLKLEQDELSKRLAVISTRQKEVEGKKLSTGFEIMILQHDLDFKMNRSSKLRELLSSNNVRPTILMEPVSVFEQRFTSKLWRACLLGALIGIFISAIWIRWGK